MALTSNAARRSAIRLSTINQPAPSARRVGELICSADFFGWKSALRLLGEQRSAMADLDRQLGDILTGWQICPHEDAGGCACRKPKAGLILELAEVHGVDLKGSTMVGDQEIDDQAAGAGGVGKFVYAAEFFGRNSAPTLLREQAGSRCIV
jgi:hypothetical protein